MLSAAAEGSLIKTAFANQINSLWTINKDAPFEFIIKGRVYALGYSSVGDTTLFTEIGTEAKQRVNSKLAIVYRLEDYYTYRSNSEDDTEIGISLGGDFF